MKFIRYPGGKRRLLRYIIPYLPLREAIRGKYIEPFVGGGAVFFALNPRRAVLSDINKELIDLYLGIKYRPSEVWQIFSGFPTTKEGYYRVRDHQFETDNLAYKAARILYLNRTCFKGMWRHNASGNFNVGYGGQDRRWVVSEKTLSTVSRRLKNARLKSEDFQKVIDSSSHDDFIFVDPPYSPSKKEISHDHYVYSRFTYSRFVYDDHVRLATALKRATQRGVRWLLTTSSHEDIVSLFKDHAIVRFSKGAAGKPRIISEFSGEVLIFNNP